MYTTQSPLPTSDRLVLPRAVCSLVALLALALPAAAQTLVQPANRTLLLSAGKSATVKIDAGNCSPTWTATTADGGVATVTPASANAGSKRSFKIAAPKGQFSGSTTVDITLLGAGAGCRATEVITIQVFVVMDANAPKHFASGDKNTGIVGTRKRLKDLKKGAAGVDKLLNADLKTIYKQLKTGSLPAPEGPFSFPEALWALQLASDCQDEALDALEDLYIAYLEGLADDGYNLMSLYGFLALLDDFIAEEFQTGSCSLWDNAVHDASHLINDYVHRSDERLKKLETLIDSWSAKTPTPVWGNVGLTSYEFPISTGGVEPTTALKYDTAKNKVLKIKKTSASNYVDDLGGNDHGRIEVKGKAPSGDGSITITYERLDSAGNPIGTDAGDYFQETGLTVDARCKYSGKAPGLATEANLRPGQWRVTVTQGSNTMTSNVTVPTGTQGN